MKRLSAITMFMAIAGAMLTAGGCGYTMGDLYPEDVKTVAVDIFARGQDVYRRELGFRLTEAVCKVIESQTPYRLARQNDPDTKLTGTIESVEQQVLSSNPDTGMPREKEITLVLSLRWTDLRTGRVRMEVDNFRIADSYIPDTAFREDFFDGTEAVINRAARRIVEQMEKQWIRPTPQTP